MRLPQYLCLPCARVGVFAVLVAASAGCTQIPELNEAVPEHVRDADYPALIPLDDADFGGQDPVSEAEEIEAGLTGRRDRLRSRAAGLDAPIVDPETRKRMQDGVAR